MTDSGAAAPLLHLAAALGTRDLPLIRSRMEEASAAGHADAVGEVVLMAFFVTGFPAGLQAARTWAEVRPTPPTGEAGSGEDARERGRRSCAAVYGSQYENLLRGLETLHPDLPELVVEVGYGRMMARPGLSLPLRELCMVSMLIPWGAETPLYSHLRGALLVGADPVGVEEAIEAGLAAVTGGGAALTGGGAALTGGGPALSESGRATALAEGVRQLWNTVRERVSSQTAGPEET